MDWQTTGAQLAPILTGLFGLGVTLCIVSVYTLRRRARSTSYGYVREQSFLRAKRLTILAIVCLALLGASSALWGVSVRRPELLPTAVPTATSTLIPSPTPRTPTVTFTPTHTPTVTPTPTNTPIPPDVDLPAALRTPFPAEAVTPGPNAALANLILSSGEQEDKPVDATTAFPAGTERVYAFFTFAGMSRNVPWIHIWYGEVDGQMVEQWSQVELWSYDAASGNTWRFFNCHPGRGELHIYVGRELRQRVPFTVGVSD